MPESWGAAALGSKAAGMMAAEDKGLGGQCNGPVGASSPAQGAAVPVRPCMDARSPAWMVG
ncbi:hypothetical protein ACN28S_29090 [Cystobacter fuscus]